MFALTVVDMSDFPTRHPYGLGIWQKQIERIMAVSIAELPVRIYYGCEVTSCPTRGSTELETPATQPTTAVRRDTTAPEVSR
jgi:2-polyprenyl-6-methoxyphenol hydroxylase-like FAD-dependent oxidoreductase